MNIGIVGVGMMGLGIATNIMKHGHRLWLMNHPGNQPVDGLLAEGAVALESGAEVMGAVDILILCVTGSPEVRDALFSPGGVADGLTPGKTIVDCSTAIPTETEKIAEEIGAKGGHFVDAAMTRTPKEAMEGRLNLIVGAEPAMFERVRPLLACFAENIVHAGPVGSGHRMKLIHNFVSLGFSAVLAEAAACARRAGVDSGVFLEVVGTGGGGGIVFDRMKPFIESDDPAAFRFSIANALKDMGYYKAMVEAMGAARLSAEAVHATYRSAADAGLSALPVPELVRYMESSGDTS